MVFNTEFFDEGLYRMGTRCEKWDGARRDHGAHVLPLWVADMDFPCVPEVQQAILARGAHATYGYTFPQDDDYQALADFWQRRHGLTFTRDDVIMLPCVITGMKVAINALTQPGDGIIILSPVYGPFRASVEATGRTLMDAPLIRRDNGRYDMDLEAVEARLREGAKMLLLCNPHNPVSRCWSSEELTALIQLLKRYNATLISDEIHADFVYAPRRHTPILSLETENVIALCAASKTFNLAGLQQASCICKDQSLREKLVTQITASGVTSGNIFALEATRAAYQHGDAWLDGLKAYLDDNRKLLADLVAQHLPKAVLTPMEATYLAWLDLRAYGHNCEELSRLTVEAGVVFVPGTAFGEAGDGILRVNIGCPRRYLEEGILRLAVALEE